MILRKATFDDVSDVMRILAQARQAQRRAGFRQWDDGYPSPDVVEADISNGVGYILDDGGVAAGYVAIARRDEEYDRHPELWDITMDYAVFHRIAIADDYRGQKLSATLFDPAEALAIQLGAKVIRIDTGLENRPMQHILAKRGYTILGQCTFTWGERLACEKQIM